VHLSVGLLCNRLDVVVVVAAVVVVVAVVAVKDAFSFVVRLMTKLRYYVRYVALINVAYKNLFCVFNVCCLNDFSTVINQASTQK